MVDEDIQVAYSKFMKARNFHWTASHELVVEGLSLDVHNCYDFRSFHKDVSNRILEMQWHRMKGDWVDATLPGNLTICFFDVFYMRINPRKPEIPFEEDSCLQSFGYDSDEDWADGQFWTDEIADSAWRWSFEFQSGEEIIVGAGSAEASISA